MKYNSCELERGGDVYVDAVADAARAEADRLDIQAFLLETTISAHSLDVPQQGQRHQHDAENIGGLLTNVRQLMELDRYLLNNPDFELFVCTAGVLSSDADIRLAQLRAMREEFRAQQAAAAGRGRHEAPSNLAANDPLLMMGARTANKVLGAFDKKTVSARVMPYQSEPSSDLKGQISALRSFASDHLAYAEMKPTDPVTERAVTVGRTALRITERAAQRAAAVSSSITSEQAIAVGIASAVFATQLATTGQQVKAKAEASAAPIVSSQVNQPRIEKPIVLPHHVKLPKRPHLPEHIRKTSLNRKAHIPASIAALDKLAAAHSHHFTAAELAGQQKQESGFHTTIKSRVGAAGLAQFMPITWHQYAKDANHDGAASPLDPADAVDAQVRFMDDMYDFCTAMLREYGVAADPKDATYMAYNWGEGNLHKFVKRYRRLPTMDDVALAPLEAIQYPTKVEAAAQEFVPDATDVSPEDQTSPNETVQTLMDALINMPPSDTFPDGPQNVIAVAMEQYRKHIIESPIRCDKNNDSADGSCGFEIDKFTDSHLEYWCADFVSWVWKAGGMSLQGGASGGWRWNSVSQLKQHFESGDLGTFIADPLQGAAADAIFFPEHIGLVLAQTADSYITIQGNTTYEGYGNNGVAATIKIISKNSPRIVGFGRQQSIAN